MTSAPDPGSVQRAHAGRWAAIDPAVAVPADLPVEGRIEIRQPDGSLALGVSRFSVVDAAAVGAAFRALGEHALRARVAGPDARGVFGALLDHWIADVESQAEPGTDDEGRPDPVLSVSWPSRDIEVVAALRKRGFIAHSVLALRRHGRTLAPAAECEPPVVVRLADAGDHAAVLEGQLAELAYDDCAGTVRLRSGTRAAMAPEIAGAIRRGAVLVAESNGEVVGVVGIESPARSRGMTGMLADDDISYLVVLHVRSDHRGRGIGSALARAVIDAAPGPVALHHGVLNPLSAPLWARLGFRPVFTQWSRPVRARP